MKPLLQLNLVSDKEKAEAAANLSAEKKEEAEPVVTDKNLNRMLNRMTHKASTEFRRSGSPGIFSK